MIRALLEAFRTVSGGRNRPGTRGGFRRAGRFGLVPTAVVVGLIAAAGAEAYFTSTGSGSANVSVGSLAAPAIASATPDAGTVALGWSPGVTPPASDTVSYFVTRDGGNPTGNCPTAASPSTNLSCTDSGLSAGSHSYRVTAEWRSFTSTSATTNVTLVSGSATKVVLSGVTTTLTSGTTRTFTATIEDAAGTRSRRAEMARMRSRSARRPDPAR